MTLGTCPICDHTKCATCETSNNNCIKACNSDCKSCLVSGFCDSCIDGKFVSPDETCLDCDHTKCATCTTDNVTCLTNCNSDCLTCDPTAICTTCIDGRFLDTGKCLDCDKTKCATC